MALEHRRSEQKHEAAAAASAARACFAQAVSYYFFFWITFLALPAWGLRFSGSEPRVAAAVRQFVQAYRPEGLDEQMLYGVGTCFLFFWVGLGIGAFWEYLVPFLEGVWDTS